MPAPANRLIAVLHQGKPDAADPTIQNAWTLQQDLADALTTLGWQPETVYLDAHFAWIGRLLALQPRLVFNAADLGFFYDITLEPNIAAVLAAAGLRYTGSGAYAAALSGDKYASKVYLAHLGVPVPQCWLPRDAAAAVAPVILKERLGHNSFGLSAASVLEDRAQIETRVQELGADASRYVLEEYIDGEEAVAGFLGNAPRLPMPVFAIDYGASFAGRPKILDYDAKWAPGSDAYEHSTPTLARHPPALAAAIQRSLGLAAEDLGMWDYGRCDFRIRAQADGTQIPYLIDINTNPDLSRDAGMFRMAAAAGLSYADLIGRVVDAALQRQP